MGAVSLIATGCSTLREPGNARNATTEDILASTPDPEKRQRWEEAINSGKTPPVSAIEIPADPVTLRTKPVIRETGRPANPPSLGANMIADVKPVNFDIPGDYAGPATIIDINREVLRLAVEEREMPIEIRYRRPSQLPLPGLEKGATVNFEFRNNDALMPAQMYDFAVIGADRRAALVYLLANDTMPIERTYNFADIEIGQLVSAREQKTTGGVELPVRLRIGDQGVTLKPGETLLSKDWDAPYDVVLFHSMAYPSSAQWSDTAPYSLTIAIFAAE